ncbi:MAG: L,D-transpeptidase [Methylobacteriaceae bacterium]|nr:L,D-transpeptidase [Methylobacteriaceae bacterium]
MRLTLLALAGLSAGLAFAQPAAAQSPFWSDPMGDQDTMKYIEGDPRALQSPIPRQVVAFTDQYAPGTIVISTSERRLYLVTGSGEAIEYGVGVGRPGFAWSGIQRVSAKKEWPAWTPPAEMRKRRPDLPAYMSGGPENPLGARAIYLGSSLYRIHGSNEPDTIGQAVSSGCIRMTNEDVIDLYDRVKVGAKVVVLD